MEVLGDSDLGLVDEVTVWGVLRDGESWERRPNEDAFEYEWFTHYRDMPPPRSVARSYRSRPKQLLSALYGSWVRVARRHAWIARAYVYDRHLAELKARELAAEQAQLTRDHLTLAAELRMAATEHLKEREHKATQAAAQAAGRAFEIARTEMGLPVSVTKTEAELRGALQKSLQAQEMLVGLVREGLCPACFASIAETLTQIMELNDQAEKEFGAG